MENFEAQKIIKILENIAAEKGANALTGEVIEECCRANGVDPEDFRNFICENIDLQEIKKLQGLEELSFEELDQVAGGAQSVKQGIASFLAATSLLGSAANFTASAAPFGANQSTSTARHGKDTKNGKQNQSTKIKAGLALTLLAAPIVGWALWLRENDTSTNHKLLMQARANCLKANKINAVNFAGKISNDIQKIYNNLRMEDFKQFDNDLWVIDDKIADKIADLMLHEIKNSYPEFGLEFKSEDPSVKLPGATCAIDLRTFLHDYTHAMFYSVSAIRISYDLADYVMALYLDQHGFSLEHISDSDDPGRAVYKETLAEVKKALKLDSRLSDSGILLQVHERRLHEEEENWKKMDGEAERLIEELTKKPEDSRTDTEKKICEKYKEYEAKKRDTRCVPTLTQLLTAIEQLNEQRIKELEKLEKLEKQDKKSRGETLEHIKNLQEGFADHKTNFEDFLIDVSNYFKEKLESGATYESLNKTKGDLTITVCEIANWRVMTLSQILKHLGELANSSEHSKDKKRFLMKLHLCLNSLIGLLRYQSENCAKSGDEKDKDLLNDLLEKTYAFYNIVHDNVVCSKYNDESSEDECTPAPTDREFLQTLLNNDCVGEEQKRVCAVGSTIDFVAGVAAKSRDTAADKVFAKYQNNYAVINDHLRKDKDWMDRDDDENYDDENYCENLERRLQVAIKKKKTEQDLELFRGVSYNIRKGNYGYQKYERMLNETVKEVVIDGKINWEKLAKKLESAAQTGNKIIFTEKAFLSATTSKSIATGYKEGASGSQFSKESDAVVYHIHVPKNTPYYCTSHCSTHPTANFFFLPETKLHLKEMTIEGGEKRKDGTTCGTKDHPRLVSLYFEMIPPTDAELEQAAKDRAEWWRTQRTASEKPAKSTESAKPGESEKTRKPQTKEADV